MCEIIISGGGFHVPQTPPFKSEGMFQSSRTVEAISGSSSVLV